MKLIFLLFTILQIGALQAQKRYKKPNHDSAFPYSYKCFGYNYRPNGELFMLMVFDYSSDSLMVYGSAGDTTISGRVAYDFGTESSSTPVIGGSFKLYFLKNNMRNVLSVRLFLNGYDDADFTVGLYLEEETVFNYIYKKTIFDSNTPYVIVYSNTILTSKELHEILVCLPPEHDAENVCFDPKKVQIIYPE